MRKNLKIQLIIASVTLIAVGWYALERLALVDYKFIPNSHGYELLNAIEGLFREQERIGSYVYKGSKRARISVKDPHLFSEEGKLTLSFLDTKIANNGAFDITIKHYDGEPKIESVYDAVCNRRYLENCTPLLIDSSILFYPEIFAKLLEIASSPCEYWTDATAARAEEQSWFMKCNQDQDAFGKIVLGLTDEHSRLIAIIKIPRQSK